MEPDEIPVHDLLGVGGEPEPGPDELRAIVARAGRKRWMMAGTAATLALGLGLGIGFATSHHNAPASQTAAGGSPSGQNTPAGGTPAAGAGPGTSSSGSMYTNPIAPATSRFVRAFTRTTGGITIRGFLVTFPQIAGVPAGCGLSGSRLQVEVSTASMVGTVGGGLVGIDRSRPLSGVSSEVVGTAEGGPTAVLIAATGPGVAKVSMSFAGGGADTMTPVNGWVALAAPAAGSPAYGTNLGTLSGRDAAGKVVSSQAVQLGVLSPATSSPSCSIECPGVRPQAGANAPAATGSASGATRVACPPLPVRRGPCVTLPPGQTPSTSGSNTVNPGGPTISSAGGGASYACPLPARPSGGASSSSGQGASP